MAQILDNKSEVISVELTKYGKKLLSQGLFNPDSYLFFDDSVIYDDKYTGNTLETTNEIQDKILYKSINTRFLNIIDDKEIFSERLIPLGRSSTINEYAPAWDLRFIRGTISSISASSTYFKKEIDINNIESTTYLQQSNLINFQVGNNSTFELDDGRVLIFNNEYILIELSEENVDDDYKNFDIEIYTYDKLYGTKENNFKRKLSFTEKQTNIIDGLIYDDSELPASFFEERINQNDSEYYFDVLVDDEIDTQIIATTEQTIKDEIKPIYKPNIIDVPKEDC